MKNQCILTKMEIVKRLKLVYRNGMDLVKKKGEVRLSKIEIFIYRDDKKVFQQECDSYLLAANVKENNQCSIIAQSESNMRHLVASCMASALGILLKKGNTQKDIDKFFQKAIYEMVTAEQVQYEQVNLHEPIQ